MENIENNILEGLNNKQREAVECLQGPLLILAGAGSGKTRTILTRIAYILEQGLAWPSQILAITFTNKAASEMRERIAAMEIPETERIWMSTFHSACCRILRANAERLGYTKQFKILDTDDQRTLLKKYAKQFNLDPKKITPAQIASRISHYKNTGITPKKLLDEVQFPDDKKIAQIYATYQKDLKRLDSMDFDDLILNTIKLFEENKDILSFYQKKFKYILVDEYQDTNATQYHLVQLLAQGYGNLCVCGDDDQSIYGWRGADINNILNFENDWPDATVIKLEENYRSTKEILECANCVIKNNKSRKPKALWTANGSSNDKVNLAEVSEGRDEADFVAEEIKKLREDDKYDYNDFVVLYRTNAQSRNFEESFRRRQIPYKTVGSISFYARAEIKDILSYLSLLNNSNDDISFLRIVNQPKRGIGAKSVEKLSEFAEFKGWSLYETCKNILEVPTMTPAVRAKFKRFYEFMESMRKAVEDQPLAEIVRSIYTMSGYEKMLLTEKIENAESRRENVEELVTAAKQFSLASQDQSITAFLESAALSSSTEEFDSEGQVSLMTLHSAKGLEYPVVFMTGMENNLFPSFQSIKKDDVEEERRLCYVGITRAQEKLYLSWAQERMIYGHMNYNEPSIFIDELPKENITVYGRDKSEKIDDYATVFNGFKEKNSKKKINKDSSIFSQGANPSVDARMYKAGDKVKHKVFGDGTVIQVKKSYLVIAFPKLGIKTIDAAFVTLQ